MSDLILNVGLPASVWRSILNLLTEELDVWPADSDEYRNFQATISLIERRTGIRKMLPYARTNCVNCGHTFNEHTIYQEPETRAYVSRCIAPGCKCPDWLPEGYEWKKVAEVTTTLTKEEPTAVAKYDTQKKELTQETPKRMRRLKETIG